MKAIFRYSEKKFRSLSPQGQLNAFTRMLKELERQACEGGVDPELLQNISLMAGWTDTPDPLPGCFVNLTAGNPDRRELALQAATWLFQREPVPRDDAIAVRQADGHRDPDPDSLKRAQDMVVICEDLRSAFNVGSIFRSAECLGIGELWLCGISACPGDPALEKTAMGTSGRVAWKRFPTAREAIVTAKAQGRRVYALETAAGAASVFDMEYIFPCALLLGNEALGISDAALQAADELIELPVQGWKNSLNVGVAFAVCAYQMIFKGAK